MSRCVLDADIVLAAFAGRPGAPPALLLAGVHNGDLKAVACPLLIEEVRDNLAKPYFRALLSELEAQEAVEAYSDLAVMLADPIDVEDLLDHMGLRPQAIEARAACELIGLIERR